MHYAQRLHAAIPGGAHTYSRGDDQFPVNAPPLFERGEGVYVYTPENERFLDYGMALRAVTVGYAEKSIADAAIAQILYGNAMPRASLVELLAAEALIDLIPPADMVKFAKNGSNATTAATKIARAATGRKYIARCLDHPFFSFDDWFIGDTPLTLGIPPEHYATTLHFNYNNLASLQKLFDEYPSQIAGIIMEPATVCHPDEGYLASVQNLCKKEGALFILDEMITGFRWHVQGAQAYYGISPDLSTFGKGMANGFSVAALMGKKEFMNLGGIQEEGKEKLFLTSTTHGAEMCGMGALLATIDFYKKYNVVGHMWQYGQALMDGMNALAHELGVGEYFRVDGIACSPYYTTRNAQKQICLGMRTLFAQEMIRQGVLMSWIALAYRHGQEELQKTLDATHAALTVYAQALESGYERFLVGKPIKPVFRKYV